MLDSRSISRTILSATSALFSLNQAAHADPVGYVTRTIPGNQDSLVPLQLAYDITKSETVAQVTAQGIRFTTSIPANVFSNSGRGFMEVRIGAMAGLAIPATGFSGDFLYLERSPVGLVSPGDRVTVRPEMTIRGAFGEFDYQSLQIGSDSSTADTVSTFDPRTQTSKIYYLKTGAGWREAGKEAEGDKGNTPILFPGGVIIRRRAATSANITASGCVIMPLENRYHPVWPGRNIISAPFTNAPSISFYIRPLSDAPFTVKSGASAPKADTLRFTLFEGGLSPVMYFQNDQWKEVGTNEDSGDVPIGFVPCLDLQRVGDSGYVHFHGIDSAQAAPATQALTAPVTEIQPVQLDRTADGLTATWPAEAGKTYQVQTRPPGSVVWTNLKDQVHATGTSASLSFRPSGQAVIRVIVP